MSCPSLAKGRPRRKQYLSFVEEGIAQGRRTDLVGGGLIRSLGVWAEVLSVRRRKERQAYDQRVLGDDEFVKRVLSEANDLAKENLRFRPNSMVLPSLAERVCRVQEVSLGELRSGSRRHEIMETRRVFSWLAVKELGYSGAAVARYLEPVPSFLSIDFIEGGGKKRGIEEQKMEQK